MDGVGGNIRGGGHACYVRILKEFLFERGVLLPERATSHQVDDVVFLIAQVPALNVIELAVDDESPDDQGDGQGKLERDQDFAEGGFS